MKPRSEGGAMSGWGFGSIPSREEGETRVYLYKKSTAASHTACYPLSKARMDDF